MKALIDADIICYEFGNMKDLETEELLAWPITRKLVDDRISDIISAVECDSYVLYLTDSKSNFRNRIATILPYKGQRKTEKPPHWEEIRQHLIDNYDAQVQYGIEADDRMGIAQYEGYMDFAHWCINMTEDELSTWREETNTKTIICSRDKDMDMIPGWHYSWECGSQKEKKWFVDEQMGIRSFYKQLLTGDTTDNILGLYGVGAKAACVKRIDTYTDEIDMFREVSDRYEERFGAWWMKMLFENAALLWIMRNPPTEDYDGVLPSELEIHDRLGMVNTAMEMQDDKDSEESSHEALVQDEDIQGQDKV